MRLCTSKHTRITLCLLVLLTYQVTKFVIFGSHNSLWKTLTYIEVEDDTNKEVWQANAEAKKYFQSLVDDILKADPAIVRRMSQVLEDELHPNGTNIPEPHASSLRRGRPIIIRTLWRNKSAFEYNSSSFRGRGSRSSSRPVVGQLNHPLELTSISYLVCFYFLYPSNL